MIESILAKALRHYGHNQQVQKCLEEMAELSVALHHHLGDRTDLNAVPPKSRT